ncbi:hypothetical protein CMUS01_15210 [Colletotrichum musicola]|uniref:Uncharacterized protein n=1 Tax=Colletotrichum musicola TaxID=2175873 RepID=A0A8H6IY09_9PEZI|nr:hypothetical protein CMUS01_15210 [Colletotrichum musicola]
MSSPRLCAFMSPDRLNSAAASQTTAGTRHLCALYSSPQPGDAKPAEEDPMFIPTLVFFLVFMIVILVAARFTVRRLDGYPVRLFGDEWAERRTFEGPEGRCALHHEQDPLPLYTGEVLPPYVADEQEPLLGDDRSDCPSYHTFSMFAVREEQVHAEESEQV